MLGQSKNIPYFQRKKLRDHIFLLGLHIHIYKLRPRKELAPFPLPPSSPTPRPSPVDFLFQEFVKSSYLLDSLCLVEHRSSLSTNLDRVLEFGMDQLSRKILFAGLAQEYHVSFVFHHRQRIQFDRRSCYYLIGKQ